MFKHAYGLKPPCFVISSAERRVQWVIRTPAPNCLQLIYADSLPSPSALPPPFCATSPLVWHPPFSGVSRCGHGLCCHRLAPPVPAGLDEQRGVQCSVRRTAGCALTSQWVFSSLKCCGKRLPLLSRFLLRLGWKQNPFVAENAKQVGLRSLPSGTSMPASTSCSSAGEHLPAAALC